MNGNVRTKGLLQCIGGLIGAIIVGFGIYWLDKQGYQLTGWGMLIVAVPGGLGVAGLIQFVSGIPFLELSQKWDDLEGWQRGALGLFVVALCLGALVGGIALWGYLTM